jgi:hypothetical protein
MSAPSTLHDAWPLFGLRIRTAQLVLRVSTDEEQAALRAVAKAGIHGPDEIPFLVPWSTPPSPELESSRERTPVVVDGLDACREACGVGSP